LLEPLHAPCEICQQLKVLLLQCRHEQSEC
jgi:hypothetical protein